jgi:hypothetical protein
VADRIDLTRLSLGRRVPGLDTLPASALRVLAAVWELEAGGWPVTVRGLTRRLGININAVAPLLARLEEAGLVDRGPVVPQTLWPDAPWKRRHTPRRSTGRTAGAIRSRCRYVSAADLGRADA